MSFDEKISTNETPQVLIDNSKGIVTKAQKRYEIITKDGYLMVMTEDGQETRRGPSGFFPPNAYRTIMELFEEAKRVEVDGSKGDGFKFDDPEQALRQAAALAKLDLAPDDEENTSTSRQEIIKQERSQKGSSFATDPDYYKNKK